MKIGRIDTNITFTKKRPDDKEEGILVRKNQATETVEQTLQRLEKELSNHNLNYLA